MEGATDKGGASGPRGGASGRGRAGRGRVDTHVRAKEQRTTLSAPAWNGAGDVARGATSGLGENIPVVFGPEATNKVRTGSEMHGKG